MKYLVVVFVMSVLAFVSCGRYDYPAQLVKVDSLCDVCPDSAVAMLKAMEGQCAGFSSDAKWYYRLLGLKAHCKAYSGFSEKDTAEANAVLAHYVDGETGGCCLWLTIMRVALCATWAKLPWP